MKGLLLAVGAVALLAGLLFAGQGLGYIPWPRTSFMISDMHWVTYGAGIAAAGLVLIWISRR
jgi:hypothetical protein